MASKDKYYPGITREIRTVPFEDAAEAWFWFIDAQQARLDGARITAGLSLYPRPCEPMDILKVVERLYRMRRLTMDHLLVMRHYGRRRYAPDARRIKEMRAANLWGEALDRLEPVLETKGIVLKRQKAGNANWVQEAVLYEQVAAE